MLGAMAKSLLPLLIALGLLAGGTVAARAAESAAVRSTRATATLVTLSPVPAGERVLACNGNRWG